VKKDGRYDVSDLPEAQFEPGSNEQVLRNLLGIKSPKEMGDTETRALERAMGTAERHVFFRYSWRCRRGWKKTMPRWSGYSQRSLSGALLRRERLGFFAFLQHAHNRRDRGTGFDGGGTGNARN